MPDRYLREALLNSERWNTLSLDARDCYVRLVLIVDDYGCYDGRPALIAAHAYRYGRTEALPLPELQRADLVVRYTNAGRPFIAITQWGEVKRGIRKFPAPPINNDRAEVRYMGVFGRAPAWQNPPRCDAVSVLLDVNGRPVQPQPPEWRRTTDWSPLDSPPASSGMPSPEAPSTGAPSLGTPSPTRQRSIGLRAVTVPPSSGTPRPEHPVSSQQSTINSEPTTLSSGSTTPPARPEHPRPEPPSPTTSAATSGNGKYELDDNGAWAGVSDAQRARWQEMFSEMSVPDQIERAGAWLVAHPAERKLYTDRGELEQYLIRWLLNESRQIAERTVRAKAGPDSQGKR